MEIFLSNTVIGIVAGCVYALIAAGLVVTYNTTGIFNFSHGAIAMVSAYMYWQFTDTASCSCLRHCSGSSSSAC
jgi:branched-chain amino acid transport system permease protein